MKPRVARIVSYLPVGGVEKRLLAVLKRLKDEFDVEVICIHSRGKLAPLFEEAGIPVTVIPFKGRLHPVSLYKLASYLRKNRVDIVHTHMYRPNISGTLAARLAKVPVVISNVHNVDHWDTPRQVFMDRLFHTLRDRIIAVSHAVRNDILKKSKAPPEKTVVIYNGINMEDFSPKEEDIFWLRRSLKLPREAFVVSLIARLVPAKSHKNLFKAVSHIEKISKNILALIVGGGGYRSELEKVAKELGLERVWFLGERSDVPLLLKITNLSVLPSSKEGFSNVILESMAAGTPVVASEVGGAREAIEPFHTGVLVKYGDVESLQAVILGLLGSPRNRISIKTKARKMVEKRFSIEEMAAQTKRLYLDLLGKAR